MVSFFPTRSPRNRIVRLTLVSATALSLSCCGSSLHTPAAGTSGQASTGAGASVATPGAAVSAGLGAGVTPDTNIANAAASSYSAGAGAGATPIAAAGVGTGVTTAGNASPTVSNSGALLNVDNMTGTVGNGLLYTAGSTLVGSSGVLSGVATSVNGVGTGLQTANANLVKNVVTGTPMVGSTVATVVNSGDNVLNPLVKATVLNSTVAGSANPASHQVVNASVLSAAPANNAALGVGVASNGQLAAVSTGNMTGTTPITASPISALPIAASPITASPVSASVSGLTNGAVAAHTLGSTVAAVASPSVNAAAMTAPTVASPLHTVGSLLH